MLSAQTAIMLKQGIKLKHESTASIGLSDSSACWGLWVPDRKMGFSESSNSECCHFVICPFEPLSWPVLIRITIFLKDDGPGSLYKALSGLSGQLNILWLEVVPAGHHHCILSLIAEDWRAKFDGSLNDFKHDQFENGPRNYTNLKYRQRIHDDLVVGMLDRCSYIEEKIMLQNGTGNSGGFLRETFLSYEDERHEIGVQIDSKLLTNKAKHLSHYQSTPAVKCTWLQNMAFFWLYGKNPTKHVVELSYDYPSRLLKVDAGSKQSYEADLPTKNLPLKTVGSVNNFEKYVRLTVSQDDLKQNTVRVIIPYDSTYNRGNNTQGFQAHLYERLAASDINLRYVSMYTQKRTLEGETGSLSILATSSDSKPLNIEAFQETVGDAAKYAASKLGSATMRCNDDIEVKRTTASRMFFSTKFDWLLQDRPSLLEGVEIIANRNGFSCVVAQNDRRKKNEELVPEAKNKNAITDWTTQLVKASNAFLQIVPCYLLQKPNDGGFNWLLYEFGVAQALEIPCAILVDCRGDYTIDRWKSILRVGADYPLYSFDSGKDDKSILIEVGKACFHLYNELDA